MDERIQRAVDEALEHGPPVVSGPGGQWIKDPDKGWDTFPPLYYVSKHCEPYLNKYYPRWRRAHVSRDATYTYLRKRTMGRKATPADMPSSRRIMWWKAVTSLLCTGSSCHGHWSAAYYPHPTRRRVP